jgi:hypothetical protein
MGEPPAPKADPGSGGYDVLAKWKSPSFNDITRAVLDRRLHQVPERRFLHPDQYRLLEAACARLIPQSDRPDPVPIAPFIDADLFEGRGDGFRPPDTPPIPELWRRGLARIEAESRRRFGAAFADLALSDQDAILKAVQAGDVAPESFAGRARTGASQSQPSSSPGLSRGSSSHPQTDAGLQLGPRHKPGEGEEREDEAAASHSPSATAPPPIDPVHFFVQVLLKSAVAVYYSHPAAWNEIGYGGPASPRGYVRMGLNERDPWEAPLAPAPGARP